MGQEIESSEFTDEDMARFKAQLVEETGILERYFDTGAFDHSEYKGGFELEAWLLDKTGYAAPDNAAFLVALDNPEVVPELATFNFEVNGAPQVMTGKALDVLYAGLLDRWRLCERVARQRDESPVMIGILPHLRESDLCLANMSSLSRYEALNRQVLKMRNDQPLHLVISGKETMDTRKYDVMLEAATTSFQIHFQIPLAEATDSYNAAIVASAPLVAVAANSPFLFGKQLWEETRIPLFEQSVQLGEPQHRRVGFGSGYIRESLFECFRENLEAFPVLLPLVNDSDPARLSHLKFHNGTIWRWNRPLIDFGADNRPHLRIEHRVVPAGPTITDSIANAAFFYGLCHGLTLLPGRVADLMSFDTAKNNFYACARYGLDAEVIWSGFRPFSIRQLVLDELLPLATTGLADLGIDSDSAGHWLDIVRERTANGMNGAAWQRQWASRHGRDMHALVKQYQARQQSERPVHEWDP